MSRSATGTPKPSARTSSTACAFRLIASDDLTSKDVGVMPRNRQAAIMALAALSALPAVARAYDISAPPILQDFENTDATITNRMPDIFAAGYGAIWFP